MSQYFDLKLEAASSSALIVYSYEATQCQPEEHISIRKAETGLRAPSPETAQPVWLLGYRLDDQRIDLRFSAQKYETFLVDISFRPPLGTA
jgi:hypothetical protein